MMTVPQTRFDLLAAPTAAAGMCSAAGHAGAVYPAGVATAVGDAPKLSGNIAPISWLTHARSRNRVATVVTPAA